MELVPLRHAAKWAKIAFPSPRRSAHPLGTSNCPNAGTLLQVVEEPEDRVQDERDERDADEDVLLDLGAREGTETLHGET